MALKRFLDITDFSREELRETLNHITYLKSNSAVYSKELECKTIVNAFYEEDKMTESAFSSTVAKMSGTPVPFSHIEGVSLRDEARIMSSLGDAIVVRHPKKGAARAISMYATVPVINAGDGGRAFPVRTLADVSTIWLEKKHVSNMKIGFLGDFADNAQVKNLLQCLNLYKGNEFYFISVNGKPLGDDYVALMDKREKDFAVYDNLFEIIGELDVLYMTKVSKESFESEIMYESRKHNFILDEKMLMLAKPDLLIMHALPRGEELSAEVDNDPRAKYFSNLNIFNDACQETIVKSLTNKAGKSIVPEFEEETHKCSCNNPECITSQEEYLPNLFYELADGRLICKYCSCELKNYEKNSYY